MFKSIHPIPAFNDNYIWIISDPATSKACVVDPGDAKPVISYLQKHELQLSDILITHHHADHTGGLSELNKLYSPNVYGPKNKNIDGISTRVGEGDSVEVFGHHFSILEVPGHTLDHIAYYCDETSPPVLFCGDTLFAAGCGRLFEGTAAVMHDSLMKLKSLASTTLVYCTHEYTMANLKFAKAAEPTNTTLLQRIDEDQRKREQDQPTLPSTLELELATNPFLRCDQSSLQESAGNRLGHPPTDEIAAFAAIRDWKDNF
jgi:hydroxyacylglutathione hydrolase